MLEAVSKAGNAIIQKIIYRGMEIYQVGWVVFFFFIREYFRRRNKIWAFYFHSFLTSESQTAGMTVFRWYLYQGTEVLVYWS